MDKERTEQELLVLHTKLAGTWLVIGFALGLAVCWSFVRDAKRPVVEVRVDSPAAAANGVVSSP